MKSHMRLAVYCSYNSFKRTFKTENLFLHSLIKQSSHIVIDYVA